MQQQEFVPDVPEEADQQDKEANQSGGMGETLRTVFVALLIALLFRSFAYEPFHIPSGSMKENLLVGDYLFVSKYTYGYSRYSFPLGFPLFEGRILELNQPQRGDVVVFRLPRNPRIDFIKRIIGLPGDRIQVLGGVLYINGKAVPQRAGAPFVDKENPHHILTLPSYHETLPGGKVIHVLKETSAGEHNNTQEYIVPAGHYFMMGDNRDNSRDSRFLDEVGFVPKENIVGKAQMIFFSSDGSAGLFEVWKWLPSMRFERFFKSID